MALKQMPIYILGQNIYLMLGMFSQALQFDGVNMSQLGFCNAECYKICLMVASLDSVKLATSMKCAMHARNFKFQRSKFRHVATPTSHKKCIW